MDEIDRGILKDFLDNCRATYEDLSRKYKISANAIRKRVIKLEESGVIHGYAVSLSRKMVDADYVFGLLTTDGSKHDQEFVDEIGTNPNITAAASYTNGLFAMVGEYTNQMELLEIGAFLRSLEGVEKAELHPIVSGPGEEMILTKLHLRVLACLMNDPRMSLVEIAEQSGLTARRVRKLVDGMIESKAVRFSALLELGAATSIPFIVRIGWDESKTDTETISNWFREEYPLTVWEIYVSAVEPTIFCLLAVQGLTDVDEITQKIREQEFTKTARIIIATHHKYFGAVRHKALKEMIEGVSKK